MVTKLERENNTIFYLHNAWANSPDGTAGFTLEESEDAAYIGNCISMSSAEVLNPSSYNWIAVEFEAVEESDTAELTELGEDVPEDPEDEDDDYSYEDYMDGAVQSAADTATTAQESADIAQQKAEEATASAALAQQKAEEATASAAEAKTAADTAREKAEAATTDAATAKQKAEEATSSAALAQQKAESATAAAGAAHAAAESATSDARTAGIAAATAQAAAEAAQGDIDEQKKYFYHDKLGAHVLDAAGGKFRTDIKSDRVQIVQTATETPIATYGEVIRLGEGAGQHITVSGAKLVIQDGDKKQFEVKTLTSDMLFTDVWLDEGQISPDSGLDKSKVFSAEGIASVLDSTYYDEEILNLTFPSQGVPKVTLIFGSSGNSGYNVPTDSSSAIYFTAADQSSGGESLKLVIDYRDNPSGVNAVFNWSDLRTIKVEYALYFTPTTVRIGDGATADTFGDDGTPINSFKALKIGKGKNREGNWQNDNAFDVDFNGNTYVGGELAVNQDIVNIGGQIYTGAITVITDVYARNVYSERQDGTMLSITDLIYPVGSVYISVNSTNPGVLFGGTWQQIKDKFLLSAGDTYAAGSTGGSAKATLPSHTHTVGSGGYQLWGAKSGQGSTEPGNQISGDAKYYAAAKGSSASNYKWLDSVDSKGVSDVSQANMPPYLVVYVWQRIS